jgi:PAS domain S-box-containing protein
MTRHWRLSAALLLPFIACGLQWLLWDPWIKPFVWFLFFPVTFFAAWLGGVAGGIGATLISAGLVWYLFIPPPFSFDLESRSAGFSILVFIIMGGLFTWLFQRLRSSQLRSDSRFLATFEQAAVGLGLVAPDGRWLRVNHRLCATLGYSAEELLARTFQDITHPDDLGASQELVRRLLAGEMDSCAMEKRYLRQDGSQVWVNLTVALARKPDGTPDYFISAIEDIQGRKEAEAALRDSEFTYRSLFDSMLNGYAYCRMLYQDGEPDDFLYLNVNPAFERQTGLGNVVGRKASEVIPGIRATDPGLIERYARVARGGPPESFEIWVESLGQWFSVTAYSPRPDHFIAVFDVVTARKQAEERFRQLFDLAPVALTTSGRDGRIQLMNRAFVALLGYTLADTPTVAEFRRRAQPDPEVRRQNDLDWQRRWQAGDGAAAEPREQDMVCADGSHKAVLTTRMRLGEDMILAVVDISPMKQVEAELKRRNQELERFDRASVGRELEMIRLKRQVNELAQALGRAAPYDLAFLDGPAP